MDTTAQRRMLSISRHIVPPGTNCFRRPPIRDDSLFIPFSVGWCFSQSQAPANSGTSSTGDSCPVVVGGMVLDIHAKPDTATRPGTTTPGQIRYVSGGVARNVAECMAKLGTKPFMISIVGNDMAGHALLEYWKSAGLATEGIRKLQDVTTPVVSNIFDVNGELASAVASVEAVEKCLTCKWIEQFRHIIRSAPILMVDANLHHESLEFACQIAAEYNVPVWFEPVSVMKSKRIASIVKYVTCVSPNEDELVTMANALSSGDAFHPHQRVKKNGEHQCIETLLHLLKPAINLLLDKGIKLVVLTLGSDGVLLCSKQEPDCIKESVKIICSNYFMSPLYQLMNGRCCSKRFMTSQKSGRGHFLSYALHFPALPASVVSLTGAGDCLVGGMLASICSGLDIMQSMAVAVSTAKAAVETEANVPPNFFVAKTAAEAKQVFAAARMFNLN